MNAQFDHYLIIDDSKISRQVLASALTKLGVNQQSVLQAASVDDAEAQWNVLDKTHGIVFLDIILPGHGGGWGLLSRFKKEWPDVPIIVLSSRSDSQSVFQARDLGASYYLIKPFTIEKLQLALQKLAARKGEFPGNLSRIGGDE
ncbi:response regulator [bacterium]|nr:response regulator [candidate division CSSED10-310 bacterium]